jgi:hypothetical protein
LGNSKKPKRCKKRDSMSSMSFRNIQEDVLVMTARVHTMIGHCQNQQALE